jgi:hypothetical protein
VTRRPCAAKPQVNGAEGPAGRPNPMASRPHIEWVRCETWRLRSHIGSQESYARQSVETERSGRPATWMTARPSITSKPTQLCRWKLPLPLYKVPHSRIHTHHTLQAKPCQELRVKSSLHSGSGSSLRDR